MNGENLFKAVYQSLPFVKSNDDKNYFLGTINNMNYYMSEMIRLGADGMDFIEIEELLKDQSSYNISLSVCKDDFCKLSAIPKTGHRFWKMKDGHKEYL